MDAFTTSPNHKDTVFRHLVEEAPRLGSIALKGVRAIDATIHSAANLFVITNSPRQPLARQLGVDDLISRQSNNQ